MLVVSLMPLKHGTPVPKAKNAPKLVIPTNCPPELETKLVDRCRCDVALNDPKSEGTRAPETV